MPSLDHLIPFFLATFVFAVMPGPAILYTAAQTLARGRSGGLLAAAGLALGGLVHVTAAAAGLSAIFTHVPELYLAIKFAGALYLVWLGIGMFRGGGSLPKLRPARPRRAFVESVVVELLNPKTAIFFIALLPQFADPEASLPIGVQLLLLGLIVDLSFALADIVAVFLVSAVKERVARSAAAQRALRYLGGSILIGLGAHLAGSRA